MKLCRETLKELISYDPLTGSCFWKERGRHRFSSDRSFKTWNSQNAGQELLSDNGLGYKTCAIFGRSYYLHRLIWIMHHESCPDIIDHIDGNPANNRLENLRSVSHQENSKNMKLRSGNKSGVLGVRWISKRSMWEASIKIMYKQKFLGYFKNFEDAVRARKDAEITHSFHENHGRAVISAKV